MLAVPVRVADCACPETPHDGHHVFVAPTISLDGGIAAEQVMVEVIKASRQPAKGATEVEKALINAENIKALTYAWAPVFVRYGAKDWDLCDAEGNPRPFDVEEVLGDYAMARLVADKCGELGYGSAVLDPFLSRQPKPSPTGRTPGTTSPRPRPIRKSPVSP